VHVPDNRALELRLNEEAETAGLGVVMAKWLAENVELPGSKTKPGLAQRNLIAVSPRRCR
jgi:hypothetical protein